MPTFGAIINDFVRADDLDVTRTVSGIPTGQTLADAWLTVDSVLGSSQVFQKHITPTLVAGQGQIEDIGTGDGIGVVRFELTGGPTGNTTALTAGTTYYYDIQVKTSAGKIYTPETGTMVAKEQETIAA
jgi:hypothetical protein